MALSRSESSLVIGVDLGGTKVEACLLDAQRQVLSRKRHPSEAEKGLDHVIRRLLELIRDVAAGRDIRAIGLGTPATYVPDRDKLFGSPHTPVYEEKGFIGRLREGLDVPLVVENDANCLALAEFYASCADKYSHVMAVILGTGVGSGLILENKLFRGAHGGAGEIGHISIDINGRLCQCGRRGCAEAYLSGPSLSRRFFELSGKKLPVPEIFRLYKQGDLQAERLFTESARIMGEVFANAVNVFDLEAIILGGGVSNLPVWYEKVPDFLDASLFGIPRDSFPLIKAKLGDSAGVFGAAYLALREIGAMSF